jgi:hypothetical protein
VSNEKMTLGKAIDVLIGALEQLDESGRETALLAASRQLNIQFVKALAAPAPFQNPAPTTSQRGEPLAQAELTVQSSAIPRLDIRSLKDQKKPNSAKQMACIVAYYLKEIALGEERKDTVSTTDLEKYFKQGGYKLPTAMHQVLVDAKASGYFESAGRGEYKLNAVGHNLVAHNLPSEA